MFGKEKRFAIKHTEEKGFMCFQIIVDRLTGVNYLYTNSGNSGGLTPLLDENGQVVRDDPKDWQMDD